ncbi:MAG: hypothetical protein R3C49_13755 [Planctomycetaceae bacterium]
MVGTTPKEDGDFRRAAIPLRRKLVFSAFVVVAFLTVAELVARLTWTPPTVSGRAVGTRRFVNWLSDLSLGGRSPLKLYESDSQRLWKLTPNQQFRSFNFHCAKNGELQPITITVNSDGYRGQMTSAEEMAAADFSVLCMGDSNFFGYPLDDRFAFPTVLTQSLADRLQPQSVRLVNGGIPGYTTVQGRIWYEQTFSRHQFDWLLLSYINNDAWLQPKSDDDLIQESRSHLGSGFVDRLAEKSALLKALRSWKNQSPRTMTEVPRVSLDQFVRNYQSFLEVAGKHRAKVLILDYCVYQDYGPYVEALRQLASDAPDVYYYAVPENVLEALEAGVHQTQYGKFLPSIRRRWGDAALQENPLLWFYAEFHPEHLNELGTAWLSDQIVKRFLLPESSAPVENQIQPEPP